MKELVKLILKYQFTLVFILLEVIACSLIIGFNHYQRTFFSNNSYMLTNVISKNMSEIDDYFSLKDENEALHNANVVLKNEMAQLQAKMHKFEILDSLHLLSKDSIVSFDTIGYRYIAARAINITSNRSKNYITIDIGADDGIYEDMAVLSNDGVVGIVDRVGHSYSTVIPLIHTNLKLSAKLKDSDYYGSLQWDGTDYRYSYLNDIPYHVNVTPGDTIVTSGFSYIFPNNLLIGYVESVDKDNANFLSIKVRLAVDFKKISPLYIIENRDRNTILDIENPENE